MKAQRVKNAVIVPTGAKGGFLPKLLPDPRVDRDAWLAEGKESYKIFIRALLSVTDHIADGKVVHPQGVTIHDGVDPYFGVAADTGTASFSDLANAFVPEQAFCVRALVARGGRHRNPHTELGIPARVATVGEQGHLQSLRSEVQTNT